ncbi:MAG: outer membrane lipoprotein-sorting protein [Thermodesulfobacteriota bacterium]
MMVKRFSDMLLKNFGRLNCWSMAAFLAALAVVCPPPCPAADDDPRARAVMEKVDARDDGDNMVADMKMILIDKNGKTRERIMRTFSKDVGPDTYQIIFFTEPAQVKDTGFLTYDYDDPNKDDDQWLYLPALKKTKRIAASDKTDSFMGSDFSYADMTEAELENYNYKLIKEDEVYGSKVWVIEAVPVNQKVIDTFGYSKSLIFVRQDNFVIVRAVLWLADSSDVKYMDVKKLDQVDGIWVAAETHMTVKKGDETVHQTIMLRNNVAFNQKLEEGLFTERSLEKGL